MVAAARARRPPPRGAQRAVARAAARAAPRTPGRAPRARGARGSRRARRGRGRRPAGTPPGRPPRRARSSRSSSCSSSRNRSTRPRTRTRSPRSKRPGEQVGVAERARLDRAAAVAQLERQVRQPGARLQAVLARAGEDAVDLVAGAQAPRWWARRRSARPDDGRSTGRRLATVDRCSHCAGSADPTDSGPPPWCARSRAGTTPARPRRRPSSFMGAALDATRFATIDPEQFVDFQATRPQVKLVEGRTREIEWPEWEVYEARVPRAPRDLVILTGPEPSYRWRELLRAGGRARRGARRAARRHARRAAGRRAALAPRVGVTAFASDPALVERLSLQPPTYEGPTGIVGVLQSACAEAGMPAASLWAAVPHYVAVAPNPKGALAILRRLESLVGVTVDAQDLETAAVDYERQVTRAVELDPEVQAFVERLERAADEEEGPTDLSQLPSGDVLAREFQRFLRQRGGPVGVRAASARNRAGARGVYPRDARPLRHHPRRRSTSARSRRSPTPAGAPATTSLVAGPPSVAPARRARRASPSSPVAEAPADAVDAAFAPVWSRTATRRPRRPRPVHRAARAHRAARHARRGRGSGGRTSSCARRWSSPPRWPPIAYGVPQVQRRHPPRRRSIDGDGSCSRSSPRPRSSARATTVLARRRRCSRARPPSLDDAAASDVPALPRRRTAPAGADHGEPLVYVSFGSEAPMSEHFPGVYRRAIDALAELPRADARDDRRPAATRAELGPLPRSVPRRALGRPRPT